MSRVVITGVREVYTRSRGDVVTRRSVILGFVADRLLNGILRGDSALQLSCQCPSLSIAYFWEQLLYLLKCCFSVGFEDTNAKICSNFF